MRDQFIKAIDSNQQLFGITLKESVVETLADYYELVQEHNPLLHLVAPCTPEEFATRHILESLTMLEHLPKNASFVDLGSGGGLPAIPSLIVRDDLRARLIESKEKKAKFLEMVIERLQLGDRTVIVTKQFEESIPYDADFITCRAIERFTERIPRILKWAKGRQFLFFGGPSLAEKLDSLDVSYSKTLTPLSRQRYLFASTH